VGRARPVLPPSRAMLTLVLGYAGLVTLIGVLATTTSVRPLVAQAFVGALLICGLSSLAGASAWVGGGLLPGIRRTVDWLRLPLQVRRCFRPAGMALGVHLLGALLLFVTALVFGWGQVMSLHRALAPGAAGTLVLVVGQLAVVPNLVIWTGAYAAGPGFAVGTDTSVAPGHVHLGALPAIPVLGALPNPGEVPSWAWAVLALPVLGGVLAGWLIMRRDVESVGSALQDAGMTALMAGTGWAVLGWLSGGPAGPGRLATFGPTVWQLGSAVVVEVALGAFVAVGIGLMVRHLAAPDGVQDDDGPGDLTPGTLAGPTLPPS
jgi:hypothetical protein